MADKKVGVDYDLNVRVEGGQVKSLKTDVQDLNRSLDETKALLKSIREANPTYPGRLSAGGSVQAQGSKAPWAYYSAGESSADVKRFRAAWAASEPVDAARAAADVARLDVAHRRASRPMYGTELPGMLAAGSLRNHQGRLDMLANNPDATQGAWDVANAAAQAAVKGGILNVGDARAQDVYAAAKVRSAARVDVAAELANSMRAAGLDPAGLDTMSGGSREADAKLSRTMASGRRQLKASTARTRAQAKAQRELDSSWAQASSRRGRSEDLDLDIERVAAEMADAGIEGPLRAFGDEDTAEGVQSRQKYLKQSRNKLGIAGYKYRTGKALIEGHQGLQKLVTDYTALGEKGKKWGVPDVVDAGVLARASSLLAQGTTSDTPTALVREQTLMTQELRGYVRTAHSNIKANGTKPPDDGAEDRSVKAFARYSLRGLSRVAGSLSEGYISGGIEGLNQGLLGGAQQGSNAMMSYGLVKGNIPLAIAGAVGDMLFGSLGALYQRGTQVRQRGNEAMGGLENASAFVAGGFSQAEATTSGQQSGDYRAAARELREAGIMGPSLIDMGYSTPAMRQAAEAAKRSGGSEAARRREAVAQDAQDIGGIYGYSDSAVIQAVGAYTQAPRFNMLTKRRNGDRPNPFGSAAYNMRALFGETKLFSDVSMGMGTGLELGTVASLSYQESMGVLSGGAGAVAGVANAAGWYGGAAQDYASSVLGMGERSIASLGGRFDVGSMLRTNQGLVNQGQSLGAIQAMNQRQLGEAESAKDFFLAPYKELGKIARMAMAAEEFGDDPVKMAMAAGGYAPAKTAAWMSATDQRAAEGYWASQGMDPAKGMNMAEVDIAAPTPKKIDPFGYAIGLANSTRAIAYASNPEAYQRMTAVLESMNDLASSFKSFMDGAAGAGGTRGGD